MLEQVNEGLCNLQHVLKISDLNARIKSFLESEFSLLEVEGEISQFRKHTNGHVYMTLKDAKSAINCTFFRFFAQKCILDLKLGDKVVVTGEIRVYEPKGVYGLNIRRVRMQGSGDLWMQFEDLKSRLKLMGYFDNKKPIPSFPKRVGIVTSKTGAALQDMIKVAQGKFSPVEFVIFDTLTQGEEAALDISNALKKADSAGLDVIVLARGGGSIQDLHCFNRIEVAETIFRASTPIISAVGHEVDYLLSDCVADSRAATPSAAIDMLLPDRDKLRMILQKLEGEIDVSISSIVGHKSMEVNSLERQIELLSPKYRVTKISSYIAELEYTVARIAWEAVSNQREKLKYMNYSLDSCVKGVYNQKLMRLRETNEVSSVLARTVNARMEKVQILSNMLSQLDPREYTGRNLVQITKNGCPVHIGELQKEDLIVISNGEVSKEVVVI